MNRKIITLIVATVILISGAAYMVLGNSTNQCTDEDYSTNNCIPAGKCHPNTSIDAIIDCDVKDYDRPLQETDVLPSASSDNGQI